MLETLDHWQRLKLQTNVIATTSSVRHDSGPAVNSDWHVPTVCVHHLVEQQAKHRPSAQALVFDDIKLTYAELNQRANQLGLHLRRFGVGPQTLVGICMERSVEMIVALLAVLKTGAAYVPLRPNLSI